MIFRHLRVLNNLIISISTLFEIFFFLKVFQSRQKNKIKLKKLP